MRINLGYEWFILNNIEIISISDQEIRLLPSEVEKKTVKMACTRDASALREVSPVLPNTEQSFATG
jgi:hypothetical protein